MSDTKLTIIYTYYGQDRIDAILKEKHDNARVVIVDDCSPIPLQPVEELDIYRITDDIKWNVAGARNLGFQESDGWIVSLDIDCIVTKKNVDDIINLNKERGNVYFLGREESFCWSIVLIHKEDFEKIGGYDEDFSGHYGFEDLEFLNRCYKNLNVVEVPDIRVAYSNDHSAELQRESGRNESLCKAKEKTPINTGKRINFNWKKL